MDVTAGILLYKAWRVANPIPSDHDKRVGNSSFASSIQRFTRSSTDNLPPNPTDGFGGQPFARDDTRVLVIHLDADSSSPYRQTGESVLQTSLVQIVRRGRFTLLPPPQARWPCGCASNSDCLKRRLTARCGLRCRARPCGTRRRSGPWRRLRCRSASTCRRLRQR